MQGTQDMKLKGDSKNHTKQLSLVCIITLIYALCYQIQSPLEPFLIDKLTKQSTAQNNQLTSAQVYAKLRTIFSIAQWFCSLGFGYILDTYGIRVGYVINFLACALCYYLLSISTTIEILYISKIAGIAMAGYLCSQAAVIKITDEGPERIKWLGLITTSYTIGGTIGPYLGGKLGSSGDYYTSSKMAALGSLFCLVLILFLPRSLSTMHSENKQEDSGKALAKVGEFKKIKMIFSLCGFLLTLKFITCIVNSMRRSAEPLILKQLGIQEQSMGLIMSLQFAFGGFTNAFLIPPITKFFGGKNLIVVEKCLISLVVLSLAQLIAFHLPISDDYEIQIIVCISFLWSVFQYTLAVSSTCANSVLVPKQIQGSLLGLQSSIFAIGFMFGPIFGIKLWSIGNIELLNWVCTGVIGVCGVIGMYKISDKKQRESKQIKQD